MRRFLIGLLLLAFTFSVAAATGPSTAFMPQTKEFRFDATTTTGTPVRIVGDTGFTFSQYRLLVSCSSATATLSVVLASTSAAAATVVQPTTVTPQRTTTYPCGTPIEIISGVAQAYFNAIVSSGTATIYIKGGEGL